jgi:uncharacterized protein (DUF2141 family)
MPRILMCSIGVLAAAVSVGAAGAELVLRIDAIPEGGGELMIEIVGSAAAFDGAEPAAASLRLPARAPAIEIATTALDPGEYAVRVMHDRNGNGELDLNLVGMPTEPWGFSNDAAGSFGPPGWDDARFVLSGEGSRHTITLNP